MLAERDDARPTIPDPIAVAERYIPDLRIYALHLTKNPHDADDLVQSAYVRFIEALPRTDFSHAHPLQVRAYLYQVCRNLWLDQSRRRARWDAGPPDAGLEEIVEAQTATHETPETIYLRRERFRELLGLLEIVDGELRAVLLRRMSGETFPAIAAHTGIPEGTLKTRLHRFRRRIVDGDGTELGKIAALYADDG